jgi:DNA-binding response OmpR family regulator
MFAAPHKVRTAHSEETLPPPLRVVVLCADLRLRSLLGYWLGTPACDVVVAQDGYEVAAAIAAGRDRLILLTDRIVPPWPGLPPLPQLRQQNSHLRVVVIGHATTGGNHGHAGMAMGSGADAALARPISRAAVMACLGSI